MTSLQLFARAECVNGQWRGEPLIEHLLEVGRVAGMLAERLGYDVDAAVLAGLLHDVGKALYMRGCEKEDEKLTFPGHEGIGYALIRACLSYNYAPTVRNSLMLAARAVALHHQGLRGMNFSNVPCERLDGKVISELLRELANEIGPGRISDVLSNIAKLSSKQLCVYLRGTIPLWRPSREARATTAILMMADNYVAYKAAERLGLKSEMSKYREEVVKYVDFVLNPSHGAV